MPGLSRRANIERNLLLDGGAYCFEQSNAGSFHDGEADYAQGLFLRYRPPLNHGHYDDLNINYIARSYEVTYDLGYGRSAAMQTQSGRARQTASHNLAVVD